MIKRLSALFISIAAVYLFWYFLGEVFVLKDNKSSFSKLECVSYAPFSKDQSPFLFESGMVISQEQVIEDLALLSKYTTCIRTYSTVGLEMIPSIARESGLKMYMGAWVSSDKVMTQKEIDTLIKLASENRDIVKAAIIGNEVLLRGDVSAEILSGYILHVKKSLPDIEVTYADVWEFWLKNPQIMETTDFITIHILPYWEDDPMNIEQSIGHLADVRGEVEAILGDKNILIGETGWPSEGRAREDAIPSKINQAVFVREFVKLAEKEGWKYNIIEAFDQPWKRVSEGAVGGFWGLFDKDRINKGVFEGDVSNFPNYKLLALGSIFLLLIASFVGGTANIGNREIVLFGFFSTVVAILFMLQIEQYSVTVRTNMELLWASVVLVAHLLISLFFLYHIARGTKPEIISIEKILGQKIVTIDSMLMVLFYLSFVFMLILNIALGVDARYRNFEVYVFAISVVSFLWLYAKEIEKAEFGMFEKTSFVVLLATSVAIFINETYLNIYSNIWILISLGFAYVLYSGSKKVEYGKLVKFTLYIFAFFVFFNYLKYGYLANSDFAAACNNSFDSLPCSIRASLALFLHLGKLGIVAVIVAIVAFFANNRHLSLFSLFISTGAVLLFNASLGAVAFVMSMFVVLKGFKNGVKEAAKPL